MARSVRPAAPAALPVSTPLAAVRAALLRRARLRLLPRSDGAVADLLAEAVYLERRRFAEARGGLSPEDSVERDQIEEAARAVHRGRAEQETALLGLVGAYAGQIHNTFSPRTYRFATSVLPSGLSRILTAADPGRGKGAAADGAGAGWFGGHVDPLQRVHIRGEVALLQRLARTHTLILTPTHLSNMDSPLIGYALHAAGLPPFIYGAGLNLFSNPVMAFFMSRLGAYTVDRRKRHQLYKDTLKDYSTEAIGGGHHSLFFPGGTRARSGEVETDVKKGLLGTGLIAWQEALRAEAAGGAPARDVLVVPCALSYAMVLEAETLIEDALKESGQRRYIISDDEFSDSRSVASFTRQILALDASVIVHFGAPLDLFGNPVDEQGRSLGRGGGPLDRRAYVLDREGQLVEDAQRDRVYTDALSGALVRAWHRDNTVMETHLVGYAAWRLLVAASPRRSTWERMFLSDDERLLPRAALAEAVDRLRVALDAAVEAGALRSHLPSGADRTEATLRLALDRFSRFHSQPAVAEAGGGRVRVAPRLALYYGNRLAHAGLGEVPLSAPAAGARPAETP